VRAGLFVPARLQREIHRATNESPYPFEWVSQRENALEYGAALIRISNEYQKRF
jgi:hypothetical protein